MSDQATQTPPSTEAKRHPSSVQIIQEPVSSHEDTHRRRGRRRRRRSVRSEVSEKRTRTFLIIVVFLMVAVALTGGEIRKVVRHMAEVVRPLLPLGLLKNAFRLEVLALFIAALILVYLMPGMEDRILRKLGLKKERRSGSRR